MTVDTLLSLNVKFKRIENHYADELIMLAKDTECLQQKAESLRKALRDAVIDITNEDTYIQELRDMLKHTVASIGANDVEATKLQNVDLEREKSDVLAEVCKLIRQYIPAIVSVFKKECASFDYITPFLTAKSIPEYDGPTDEALEVLKFVCINNELHDTINETCNECLVEEVNGILLLFMYLHLARYTRKYDDYIQDTISELVDIKYENPYEKEYERSCSIGYTIKLRLDEEDTDDEYDDDDDGIQVSFYEVLELFGKKEHHALINVFMGLTQIVGNCPGYEYFERATDEMDLMVETKQYLVRNKAFFGEETRREIAYLIFENLL